MVRAAVTLCLFRSFFWAGIFLATQIGATSLAATPSANLTGILLYSQFELLKLVLAPTLFRALHGQGPSFKGGVSCAFDRKPFGRTLAAVSSSVLYACIVFLGVGTALSLSALPPASLPLAPIAMPLGALATVMAACRFFALAPVGAFESGGGLYCLKRAAELTYGFRMGIFRLFGLLGVSSFSILLGLMWVAEISGFESIIWLDIGLALLAALHCSVVVTFYYDRTKEINIPGMSRQSERIASIRAAARDGDANGQLQLGRMYALGCGVTKSTVRGHRWLSVAAARARDEESRMVAAGARDALSDLMTFRELWLAQRLARRWDVGRAETAFRGAPGQSPTSDTLAVHPGVNQQAVVECRRAAESGLGDAETALGSLYETGDGVPQDYVEAARWYRRAADQGAPAASYHLARMYWNGVGVARDREKATRHYHAAAEGGWAEAQLQLAGMYWNGEGVGRDYGRATEWCRRAAKGDIGGAQLNMGVMCEKGRGVPIDLREALAWYRAASAQGVAAAIDKGVRLQFSAREAVVAAGGILRRNAIEFTLLFLVLDFTAWKLAQEMPEVLQYVADTIEWGYLENLGNLWKGQPAQEVTAYFLRTVVLAAAFTYVAQEALAGKAADRWALLRYLKSVDFLRGVWRLLGVTAAFYAAASLAVFAIGGIVIRAEDGGGGLTGIRWVLQLWAIVSSRWMVVVPIVAKENRGIVSSFGRSWALTGSCWARILLVFYLALLPCIGVPVISSVVRTMGWLENSPGVMLVLEGLRAIATAYTAALCTACYVGLERARRDLG